MFREFAIGFRSLGRGFRAWPAHRGLMALGLLPGVISLAIVLTLAFVVMVGLSYVLAAIMPSADSWDPFWAGGLRSSAEIGLGTASIIALATLYTGTALILGSPVYRRIRDTGFGTAGGGLLTIVLGAMLAVFVLTLGLIPIAGMLLAPAVGLVLASAIVARALLDAAPSNPRDWYRQTGFGLATLLCFLVPFGAIVIMPVAAAGAAQFAGVLDERRLSDA